LKSIGIIGRIYGGNIKFTSGIMVEKDLKIIERFLGKIICKNYRFLSMSDLQRKQADY
jgi:hypothetical protein